MMLKDRIRADQSVILQIILLLAILQLAVALLTDGFALSFDEAMWHYIGRHWFRNGLVPYSGGVDNKSPLIFAIFGLSDKLFGVNYWFPRVLGTICQSIGIFYIYKITKHIADHRTGVLAAVIYGLALLWHGTGGKYVSYTETYEIMFVILAGHKFLMSVDTGSEEQGQMRFLSWGRGGRGEAIISGIFAGIAIAFRVTAAFAILTIFIGCFRKNRALVLPFCAGVLSALGCLLLLAFFVGIDVPAMFNYMLLDNFKPGSATDHALTWKLHNFGDKFIWSAMPIFYPFLLGYLFIKRQADFLILWFIMALTGICAVGIFDVVHLKEVLPALAIISAVCIGYLTKNTLSPVIILTAVVLIFFPKSAEPFSNLKLLLAGKQPSLQQLCKPPYTIPDEGTRKLLGRWVRDNTSSTDMVFVAGFGAQVQAYTERVSPTIFFNVTQTPAAKQRFYSDMKQHEPSLILIPLFPEYRQQVSADMWSFVDSLVARNYILTGCRYNYNIYKMKR